MNPSSDFDRRLVDWLDAQAPMREPDGLTYAVLARTRTMRQLPGWASLERWLPMTVISRPALAPPLRMAWLLLISLLVLGLAAGGAIVGSRLLTSNGPDDGLAATAVIPRGDEAVFAFAAVGGDGGQSDGDIHTVRADGTDLRQLTGGPGIDAYPTWSPDGTRIAYRHRQDGSDSLVIIDAGGGSPTTMATNVQLPSCAERWSAAWSPDGTSLIFPARDGCGGYDLYIVAADGSSPATRLLSPGTNSLHAAWSPDGTQIAFVGSEASASTGLYVVEVGSGGALTGGLQPHRIGPDLFPNLADAGRGPQWSPDGSELAAPGPEGIFVVEADGSGQRLLVEVATNPAASNPAWSPDGEQLAFHRTVDPSEYWNGRPCTARTWIVNADGTDERRLDQLQDGCALPPSWSPDGTRLAGIMIDTSSDDPSVQFPFHLSFVTIDGSNEPVILPDVSGGTWQPLAAPLPPAPSFAPVSPTP